MAGDRYSADAVTAGVEPTARVAEVIRRVSEFVEREVRPLEASLAEQRAEGVFASLQPDGTLRREVWDARREVQRRAALEGFYGLHMPSDCGGGGLSRVEMMQVEEAVYAYGLGLHLATLGWTEGPSPMLAYADAEQRQHFLDPLLRAETTAAFANTEPQAGSDVLGMRTVARRENGDWLLSGHKAWITNAQYCDVVQVSAVTGEHDGRPSLTMFLVEADQPGVRRGATYPTIMDDGLTGELFFDDVRIPDANRLGEVGQGLGMALTWINWRRLCRGGMCAGWGRHLLDRAVRRLKGRQAFGASLGRLQAVQHMLADAYADWYSARATSLLAQAEVDALGAYDLPLDPKAVQLIALVKLVNDEAFFRLTDRAVQLHGAAGLGKGSPEEALFRIARNLRIPAGTVEIQRNAIARQLLRP